MRLGLPVVVTPAAGLALHVAAVLPPRLPRLRLYGSCGCSPTEEGADAADETSETTLVLGARAAAAAAANHVREGTRDGDCSVSSRLVLPSLLRAELLAHLQLPGTAVAVTSIVDTFLVVFAVLDTLARQRMAQVVLAAAALLRPPFLNGSEDALPALLCAIVAVVALGRVNHDAANNAVNGPPDIDAIVVDGLHDLRHDPLDRVRSAPAGNLVQELNDISKRPRITRRFDETYVGEVVFGQHGVGRVGRAVVMEDDVLLLLAARDNLIRARLHLAPNLPQNGEDERSDDGEDEGRQLLRELLHKLGQDRDLLRGVVDTLHNAIVPFDNWHDLLEDVLDVARELFGLLGRDLHLLLGRSGIGLELLDLLVLIHSAKYAAGNFVENIAEQTRVLLRGVLEGSLQLLDFVLGELVRD